MRRQRIRPGEKKLFWALIAIVVANCALNVVAILVRAGVL